MSFRAIFWAATALLATANAHVEMKYPVPYSVDKLDNGPITKSQYPCKSQNGFTISTMNPMKVGEKQKLELEGSAVHGGGSCQLSVTLDMEPTPDSVFKVIKSMEGGCPGTEGKALAYDFEIPASIPNGKATFAWTWFAKLSGGPEMYMNCAPIEVTGGANDDSAFKQLPDMLKANLDETCKSEANFAVKYPNPGDAVQVGTTNDAKPPIGAACGLSSGTTADEPSRSAVIQPSAAPTSAAPPSPPSDQNPATQAPTAPPAAPTQPDGVFAPGASSAAPLIPSASPITPPAGTGTLTTLVTITAKPTAPQPTGTSTPAIPTPPSEGSDSGTCTTDGAIVCNGTTKFGLCNAGKVVWQDVASGTTCTDGVIAKRGYNGRIARPRYNSPRVALSH
ncbi:hypothetical protein J1614_007509 [Plenodomus biglobosus]|nr:hypothetical protein J1614_007509 [Plenodomus biglobosus]